MMVISLFVLFLLAVIGNAFGEGLTGKERRTIVKQHNKERSLDASEGSESASNMRKMRWSRKLAKIAKTYANKCVYEHSNLPKLGIGENLYISTANLHKKGVDKAVSFWYNEKKDYKPLTGKCEPGKVCGHYKQVVWSGASRVGCGLKLCKTMEGTSWKNVYYLVCNYNKVVMKGKKPFVEAESCSNCPEGYQNCSPYKTKNLCCGNLCPIRIKIIHRRRQVCKIAEVRNPASKRSDLDQLENEKRSYSFEDEMLNAEALKRSLHDDEAAALK